MNIRIYQINLERDLNRVAFCSHDQLEKYQGSNEIDSKIYDKVYEGAVEASGLEDVYRVFNLEHPPEYRGRSLSVSDIVEVIDGGDAEPGFHFCDSFGFQKVDFHPETVRESNIDTIRVVMLEPGKWTDHWRECSRPWAGTSRHITHLKKRCASSATKRARSLACL